MLCNFIFILAKIYTTERRAEQFDIDETQQTSQQNEITTQHMKEVKEYQEKLQPYTQNNDKYASIYRDIVKEFVTKYIKDNKNQENNKPLETYNLEINIPTNYDMNYIVDFCNEIKKTGLEQFNIIEDVYYFEFECAFNLFIEYVTFAMDSIQKVYNIRTQIQDNIEFRKSLNGDEDMIRDFITSINWLSQLTLSQFEFSLLHNFEIIDAKGCYEQKNMILSITYKFYHEYDNISFDEEIMDKAIHILYDKYKNYSNKTYEKIYKLENLENINEGLLNELSHNSAIDSKDEVRAVVRAFIMKRCYATKTNYLAKSRYYSDNNLKKCDIIESDAQLQLYERIDAIITDKNMFQMKFDSHNMYSNVSIVCISTLSSLNDDKIDYLTKFTDDFITKMHVQIINKYKSEITAYFDHVIKITVDKRKITEIKKDIKRIFDKIVAIKSPTLTDLEKYANDKKLESDDLMCVYTFYCDDKFKNIESWIQKNTRIYGKHNSLDCIKLIVMFPLENGINKAMFNIMRITPLQKKINKLFETQIDNDGNTLKNTLCMLCSNEKQAKMFTNGIEQELYRHNEKNMIKSIKRQINRQTETIAENKGLIDKNMTTIKDILSDIMKSKGLIIEAEQAAIELIEIYQKSVNEMNKKGS